MQVLEDLYMGDIHPSERGFKKDSLYSRALNEVFKAGDALIGTLTEKQKEQFEDYMTAQREVNVLTDCETFCYAFKLGAKVMMDVLTERTMKKLIRYRLDHLGVTVFGHAPLPSTPNTG